MENIIKPTSFKFEDFTVYSAIEVIQYDPIYFKGVPLKGRTIITKFKLRQNIDYILLYMKKNNSWFKYDSDYNKANVYLVDTWVTNNVPKFKDILDINDYKYPPAPEILELNDNEKFRDENGNVLDIEVCGERNVNNCYFRVKDISKYFEMPNLQIIILDKDGSYELNEHYKKFSIDIIKITTLNRGNKNIVNIEVFLTYYGLLKVLFNSKSGVAYKFTKWVTKTIFTVQLGTVKDKQKLASSLLGVDIETIKRVLSAKSGKIPCIYLFFIGYAKDIIKDTTNIKYDDDDIICKFGRTDDLHRRSKEHFNTYNELYSAKIELLTFSIIDPVNEKESERAVKTCLSDYRIKIDKQKELIIIKKNKLKDIKYQYELIQNKFIGAQAGLEKHIEELKRIIEEKEFQILLIEKDNNYIKFTTQAEINNIKINHESEKKDIIFKYEMMLKDTQIELQNYKYILLKNNITI